MCETLLDVQRCVLEVFYTLFASRLFSRPCATLQVEAETDRRVRTSSVVLKKNALLAPSVQQVRRAGLHVRAGGPKSV